MLRTALALTLGTVASLGAQSQQPQRLSQADSAAIFAAAHAVAPKRGSTTAADQIMARADTVWATVWVRESPYGMEGQRVRVERRAGQWTAIRSDTSVVVLVRNAHAPKLPPAAQTFVGDSLVVDVQQLETELLRAARDYLKVDSSVALMLREVGMVGADTAWATVGNNISWTQLRFARRDGRWVARKDSAAVRGIR